ncbi:MAG: helix-turn-helix domain-containing protein [Anaerolineae bacterium]|nr:helix-turn-helix domain-containing protein [Anaerolineae bacterium]
MEALGESLGSYIRHRRLVKARQALVATRKPILDIALDHAFDSQEAFTRAFQRVFGLPPGLYRRTQPKNLWQPYITLRPHERQPARVRVVTVWQPAP